MAAEIRKEAMLYHEEGKWIICDLCAHRCKIPDGKSGICQVRKRQGKKLYTEVFCNIIASNIDPIEKKPLFHFLPGSMSYSVATVGCNFRCSFCQNWQISQYPKERFSFPGTFTPPEEIVKNAAHYGCDTIAYTYTEPTIFFETAYEIANLANKKGIYNIFVTNGYITEEAIYIIKGILNAANIDLKGFKDETYRKICGATLKGVLNGIETLIKNNIWVEITTLLVPDVNDSEEEIHQVARYIKNLSPAIPWHISRFYPQYKMADNVPTTLNILEKAYEIGREEGINFIYVGNVPNNKTESTYCPNCEKLLIRRSGYSIIKNIIKDGKCPGCNFNIPGFWG